MPWVGKGLQLVLLPHPCLLGLLWPCSLGTCVGNRQSCCLQLRAEAAAGHCQPGSHFTFCQHGVAGQGQGQGQCLGSCSHPRLELTCLSSCPRAASGHGQEDLTQEDLTPLQMEQSLGEELAAHPDGDKSERCQSHLQWKTTKWLVGRQLVEEGAGNCSSLLSPTLH